MAETTQIVSVMNAQAPSSVVLVCEHASRDIPPEFGELGLPPATLESHIAWDPGALGVALHLSQLMQAKLVASQISRLVYDCNRPPEAPDAMPAKSEVFDIPGNAGLDAQDRKMRTARYYQPFHDALASQIVATSDPVLITIHSFTPVYYGAPRAVEIGVLHDADTRLADRLLATAPPLNVQRNQPYGPQHGVTHTLQKHGVTHGYPNVMLEIRNDLIATPAQQASLAETLAPWLETGAQTCCD